MMFSVWPNSSEDKLRPRQRRLPGPTQANYHAAFVLHSNGNDIEAVFRGGRLNWCARDEATRED